MRTVGLDSAVDDIEFLSRSGHRVSVLEALTEGPPVRDTLRQVTGASSPTMGRVLSDFESRRWIEREGLGYALTPLGAFVADPFFALCDAMSDPADDAENVAWSRATFDAMTPFSAGGVYVNFLSGDVDDDRVRAAYGSEVYDRLAAVKARWDSENVFHLNQNVEPTSAST